VIGGRLHDTRRDVPQDGPLSSLLSNILLDELEGRGHRFARYADDFAIHTAISAGLSRKGPRRVSRTLATHSGMTNQWLKD